MSAGAPTDAATGGTDAAATIIAFLTRIGLPVRQAAVAGDAFLPGIRIAAGTLVVDRDRLTWPGDLLHEAGHIATAPATVRARLDAALASAPAVAHAGEAEATAWAWAALRHLDLAPDLLFHAGGYHGRSAGLMVTYGLGVYPGAHGLAQAGMTLLGAQAGAAGVPPYPHKNLKHLAALGLVTTAPDIKRGPFAFLDHPRARVAHEERGRWFPGWLLRWLYRPLIAGTVRRFQPAPGELEPVRGPGGDDAGR